jgi:hypothetical protein
MARRILLLVALLAAGCSRPAPTAPAVVAPPPVAPPDDGSIPPPRAVARKFPEESFNRGVAYLLEQQSADGSWRSDVYATFRDGTALTPLALCALLGAADAGLNPPGSAAAREKAVAWLAKFVKADGTIDAGPDGFDYPIYTASLTLRALSHPENAEHRKARDAWVIYIKECQLKEKLGWKPNEKPYGGWGYCRVVPKKPEPGKFAPPLIESNLSATVFALEALKAADALDAATAKAAAVFVRRCQNWHPRHVEMWLPEDPGHGSDVFRDGGFHFIYDDPVRNKAGPAPEDSPSAGRFSSYGSTTADGLRALRLCGLDEDDNRRWGSVEWLLREFRADTHPGTYVKAHEPNREAVYYYYAASVAKALRETDLSKAPWARGRPGGPPGLRDRKEWAAGWAAELAHELAKRQREDGSWANPVELVRENDPLVATCNAVSALAKCR